MCGAWFQVNTKIEVSVPGLFKPSRLTKQREHLKRVHSPVQCQRCYEIFRGALADRGHCLSQLASHLTTANCDVGDPSGKEGIDDIQWAAIDKQNRKKNREVHQVEAWYKIWDLLFPHAPRPISPCKCRATISDATRADIYVKGQSFSVPIGSQTWPRMVQDAANFSNLFLNIMDHKVKQGDIDLAKQESIREGIKYTAQQTFKTYLSIYGKTVKDSLSGDTAQAYGSARGEMSSTHWSDSQSIFSYQASVSTGATSISMFDGYRPLQSMFDSSRQLFGQPQYQFHLPKQPALFPSKTGSPPPPNSVPGDCSQHAGTVVPEKEQMPSDTEKS